MGAGFFGLLAGGFLGYHLANRASEHNHGWGSGRGWGRCGQQQQQQSPVPVQSTSYSSEKSSQAQQQSYSVAPDEYALFQQWKQQQQGGARSPFQNYAQSQGYNIDAVKASAVENADKALDALMAQVQGIKEKLAQHRGVVERSVPSSPQSEAGDYKLV